MSIRDRLITMLQDNLLTAKQLAALDCLFDAFEQEAELRHKYEDIKNRSLQLKQAVDQFIKTDPPTAR